MSIIKVELKILILLNNFISTFKFISSICNRLLMGGSKHSNKGYGIVTNLYKK